MKVTMGKIIILLALLALIALATVDTDERFRWDDENLIQKDGDILIASNLNAGQWTIERQKMSGWFLHPSTLWDGCVKRKQENAIDTNVDWHTL